MENKPPKSPIGLLLAGITGAVASGLVIVSVPFVLPALRKICLPYVPATSTQVSNVIKILSGRRGNVIDLGSGDGRIVIEAAKNGFIADGVELNPSLVLMSKIKSRLSGVRKSTNFRCQDLWKADLSNYNNIIIFGVEEMMLHLEKKCLREVKEGSWIIVCRYPLPNWKPVMHTASGIDSVWLYEKGISEIIKPSALS